MDAELRRFEALRAVIESISSELALEPLLGRIVRHGCELLEVPTGTIGLYDEDTDEIAIAATWGLGADKVGTRLAPGFGVAGQVLLTRAPVRVERYGALDHPAWPEFADHAVLGVPIFWREELVGFFGAGAPPPRRFSDGDLELLSLLARHAAIAIENARRYGREQRRRERLALVARLGRIITAGLALDELLQRAASALHEVLGYTNVAVGIVEPDGESFVIRAIGGQYGTVVPGLYRQAVTRGLAGAAIRSGRVIHVNDVRHDPRYLPTPGVTDVRAELAVPLNVGQRVLGVLNVESREPFGEEDANVLQIIADDLAVAIANALLYEEERRRTQRVELVARVGHIVASNLSLDELLQRSSDAVHELFGYPNSSIFLLQPGDPPYLLMRGGSGSHRALLELQDHLPVTQGVLGRAVRTRATQRVDDVAADPDHVRAPGSTNVRAELAIPIISGEEVVGVLNLEGPAPFAPQDAEVLQMVADYLAVAIRNARLYEAEQARSRRLALIARVSHIITAGLELDDLLQRAADAVHEVLGYANVDIPLVDPLDPQTLVIRARGGRYKEAIAYEDRLPTDRGIMGAAVRERRAQLVPDVARDPRYVAPPARLRVRSELALPILLGEEVLGVLNVEGDDPFTEDDAASLRIVADHLAVAIRNARLYQSAQHTAVIEERQRLSRDLHDSATQLLFSVSLLAQSLGEAWRADPAEGQRETDRLVSLSRSALAEMREIVAALHPAGEAEPAQDDASGIARLRREGLVPALRRHARDLVGGRLEVDLQAERYRPQPPEREEALFRIAQEALGNVVKHAQARRAQLRLEGGEGTLALVVDDDGIGFDPARPRGHGIASMRHRAEALGGSFRLERGPQGGTRLEVRIPT